MVGMQALHIWAYELAQLVQRACKPSCTSLHIWWHELAYWVCRACKIRTAGGYSVPMKTNLKVCTRCGEPGTTEHPLNTRMRHFECGIQNLMDSLGQQVSKSGPVYERTLERAAIGNLVKLGAAQDPQVIRRIMREVRKA